MATFSHPSQGCGKGISTFLNVLIPFFIAVQVFNLHVQTESLHHKKRNYGFMGRSSLTLTLQYFYGFIRKSKSAANSLEDRSVMMSGTGLSALNRNKSWPELPVSTSTSPSS